MVEKQKSVVKPKEENWFKRHPVMAIILGAIIVYFLWTTYLFPPERYLKGEGYEVDYFYCADKDWSDESILEGISSVGMKSLGSRESQIIDALISVSDSCPPSKTVFVTIIEPTKECLYSFNGQVVKLWYEGLGQDNQIIPEESKRIIESDLGFRIWKMMAKTAYEFEATNGVSDLTLEQSVLSAAYKDYLQNGVTKKTIGAIVFDTMNDKDSCK